MSFETARVCIGWTGAGEDRVAVHISYDRVVLAVADGVGGQPNGAGASEFVIDALLQRLRPAPGELSDLDLASLLGDVDRDLAASPEGGQSTAVVAVVTEDGIVGTWVGDSDAWLVLPDVEYQLTVSRRRKEFLGQGEVWPIPFAAELGEGTLILASDGLWMYTDLDDILSIVRRRDASLDEIALSLVSAARPASGGLWDDVGIALCRLYRG